MIISFFCDINPFRESSAIANRFSGLIKGLSSSGAVINMYVLSDLAAMDDEIRSANQNDRISVEYCPFSRKQSKGMVGLVKEALFGVHLTSKEERWLLERFEKEADCIWLAGGPAFRRAFNKYCDQISCLTFIEFSEFQQLYKQEKTYLIKRWQYWREYKVTCDVIKHVDCIAVMTKVLDGYYKKLARENTKFIHLPMTVDVSRFAGKSPAVPDYKQPYIAFTGTYTDAKDGVSVLIKSFAKIANKYPDYKLYLAGFKHPDMNNQIRLIDEFKLKERCCHVGMLDRAEIPAFVGNASLLVLSRPDSRQAQGGFPTKLGEYLATGNPVCVTKVGEIPEYLEDNVSAFMAEPGDVDSFADAMDRALSNPENAKRVGAQGRKVAEESFSAEVQAGRLYWFLKENLK